MAFTPLRIDPTTGAVRQYASGEDLGAWGLIENGGGLGYAQGKYPASNHINFPINNGWYTYDSSVHSGKPDRAAFYGSVLQMSSYNNVRSQIFVNTTSGANTEAAIFVRHTGDFTTNTSAWGQWVKVQMGEELSVDALGAVGDYDPATNTGTDDSDVFQAALDAVSALGGGVVRFENKRYRINKPIVIPVNVTLRGPHANPQGGYRALALSGWTGGGVDPTSLGGRLFWNMTGVLWITFEIGRGNQTLPNASNRNAASDYAYNSAFDVTGAGAVRFIPWNSAFAYRVNDYAYVGSVMYRCILAHTNQTPPNATYWVADANSIGPGVTRTAAIYIRGALDGAYILMRGYSNNMPSSYTDSATWNSAPGGGTMSGVAVRFDADDACMRNCFVGGFVQAGIAYLCDRVKIDGVNVDCINGFEMSGVLDVPRIRAVHGYTFCGHSNSTGSSVRRGTFLYLHDTVDWVEVVDCFCYGWRVGLNLTNVFGASVIGFAADNQGSETVEYHGVYIGQNTHRTLLSNIRVANRDVGITCLPGAGNSILMSNVSATKCNISVNVGDGDLINIAGLIASAPGTNWSSATAYNVGDFAINLGFLHRCKVAHTNHEPPEATYWEFANSIGVSNGGATTVKVFGAAFSNCLSNTGGTVDVQ